MADRPEALLALFRGLGLSHDFNVRSYSNIACACDRCNSDKRDSLFPENRLLLLLQMAARKARRIEELLENQRRKDCNELVNYHRAALRRYEGEMQGLAAPIGGNFNQSYFEKLEG